MTFKITHTRDSAKYNELMEVQIRDDISNGSWDVLLDGLEVECLAALVMALANVLPT